MNQTVKEKLMELTTISLAAMNSVRLMNRVDTKFVAPRRQLIPFLERLRENYLVQEIEGRRLNSYKTLYFDTPDKQMYLAHQDGKLTRRKVRMREYVGSDLYFFEIKNKNNHGRTKKTRKPLEQWGAYQNEEIYRFLRQDARYEMKELRPHLQNAFDRITLVNRQMTERLTIDLNLRFRNLENGCEQKLENVIIIELKQDGLSDSHSRTCLRDMRIHPMGFSKYCIGSALTNPDLKQNNFKDRLRTVAKLSR